MADDEAEPAGRDHPASIVGPELTAHLLPYLAEAVYLFDHEGNLTARVGPPGGILGFGADVGTNLYEHIHPDDIPRGMVIGAEVQAAQHGWEGTVRLRLRHADGSWRPYELRLFNRFDDPVLAGMVLCVREVHHDPDEPDHAVDETLAAELGTIADDLPTAYLALGRGGRIRFASEAVGGLLGRDASDLVGLPIGDLVIDRDRPAANAAFEALRLAPGARTVVITTRARYGGRVLEAEFHTRSTDTENKVVTVVLVDHTEEPELVRLATRDSLTGLANRAKVLQTISGLLLEPDPVLSVVYVDLDDLKSINDQHGHDAGDAALVSVAHHLVSLVRPADVVGRMSGDEFVIVCPGLDGTSLMRFVERVGSIGAGPPVRVADGADVRVTVSAGGATAAAGDTSASLLRRADEAMFHAKHHRR